VPLGPPPVPAEQPPPDIWVDYRRVYDGDRLVAILWESNRHIEGVGQTLITGDQQGNRCGAIVIERPGKGTVLLRLVKATFRPAGETRPILDIDDDGWPYYGPPEHSRAGAHGLFQFMTGSWPEPRRRPARRRGHPDDPEAPETMYDQTARMIARVQMTGREHLSALVLPGSRAHQAPVVGCPFCVDEDRAARLHARLAERWPDDEPATLTLAEARELCARGDLARLASTPPPAREPEPDAARERGSRSEQDPIRLKPRPEAHP
jgi:hypothetical protein